MRPVESWRAILDSNQWPSAPEGGSRSVQGSAGSCKSAEIRGLGLGGSPTKVQENAPSCRKDGSAVGPPLLTVAEVAGILRLSTATVYKAIRAGVIPAVRIVGQFRV